MIEEKCFRVPDGMKLDSIVEDLDEAFVNGWQYVAHFNADRGVLVILAREQGSAASPHQSQPAAIQGAR